MHRIGELRLAKDRKVDVLLDKPGSASFVYPMNAKYAEQIAPYQTGILAERYNWRATRAWRQLGNKGNIWDPIWSGYVMPIDENWTDNKMTIGCVGWMQRLGKRITRRELQWNDQDDAAIIRDLLQEVNGFAPGSGTYEWSSGTTTRVMADGYTIRWPADSVPNTSTWMKWGGTMPNEGEDGDTAYVSLTSIAAGRDHKVARFSYVMPEIEKMVNLENGCDWHLDPLTRLLTCHRRYRRIRDKVVVGFQWGPRNVAQFSRGIDAEQKLNYMRATGEGNVQPAHDWDQDDMELIGPIEEVVQLGGVRKTETLLAYAGAEILVRKDGHITYGITPFTYNPDSTGSPEPFVDYREGDQISVVAVHPPRGNIIGPNNKVRVFGLSVSIDDEDNEKLGALQLAP